MQSSIGDPVRSNSLSISRTLCVAAVFLVLAATLSTVFAASSSFGLVSAGDSGQATFGGIFVSNFTSPADLGNITQINVYLATGGTQAKAVIYSDHNVAPDALLTQSSEVTIDGASGRWVSFDVSYMGKPNTTYWLGVLLSSAGTYYYASGVDGKTLYSASASDAPNTFAAGTANLNEDLSIYAVYTTATSSAPLPNGQDNGWVQTLLLIIAVAGVIVAVVAAALVVRGRKPVNRQLIST
jgi:hypothetical protein